MQTGSDGPQQAIVMNGSTELYGLRTGFSRNQDWANTDRVACLVEILQVKRVVPNLIQCGRGEARLACLELQDK
jgi:hypothetical protein